MLREEMIERAAAVHTAGARMLRDTAAVTLPCLPLGGLQTALKCERVLADAERNLACVLSLSAGLIGGGLTKYTAACEARTRLLGVTLDGALLGAQTAAEKGEVLPGTRTDIFDGFQRCNECAARICASYVEIADELERESSEGRLVTALPTPVLRFFKRTVSDYRVACNLLAAGESATLLQRPDLYCDFLQSLRLGAAECLHEQADAPSETLAALASSGRLTALPALVYDMAVRYERLPAATSL